VPAVEKSGRYSYTRPFARYGLRLAVVLALASGARARAGYMSQTIDVPGAIGTQAEGINDSGQIVGRYVNSSGGQWYPCQRHQRQRPDRRVLSEAQVRFLLAARTRGRIAVMLGIRRRDLLVAAGTGAVGGVAGGVAGFVIHRHFRSLPRGANLSYSQSGEDVICNLIFESMGMHPSTYLDIGAWLPQAQNNTYLFYIRGARGVLVEPNVAMIPELRFHRPGDTVLNIGIGLGEEKEADYYCLANEQWNTFDREEAERRAKDGMKIERVLKMPLQSINRVIEEHFHGKAPDFISIDVEGLDLPIMKTLDFKRFRPKVICAETSIAVPIDMNSEMTQFLSQHDYVARAVTFPNTIYVDKRLLT
jgi:FkbM family methyltransferase